MTYSQPKIKMQSNKKIDSKAAKDIALRYLARRDYSRLELYQRLIRKGVESALADKALSALQEDGYQSDERFTEMYIRSRINGGDGPFKIKIALRAKGICDSLSLAVFDKLKIDWFDRVKEVKNKRFGDLPSSDISETAKQIRYLKNKGFYQDHINAVIEAVY
jgi:regulatory protein